AYALQQLWIINTTLRDNILFKLKYDDVFYKHVINECALQSDLDMLATGDITKIGKNRINLSGRQKARVSLAHAIYEGANVYILDDPLSAVDAHVRRHIFTRVLGPKGLLHLRCRIHVTNALQFVPCCNSAMLLSDDLTVEQGTMNGLLDCCSPIYASFQESLVGAATIRAYGQSDRFMAENLRKVDSNQRCVYPYLSLNRWLAVRLEFMSAFIIFATALLGVLSLLYGKGDAGLVGLSVTYALQSTQQINWMLRMECDLENSMCDYVRIQEFQDLPSEAPEIIEDNRPAKSWPEQGMVEFEGYSTRYRDGLDLVLKDLSFRVEPRQKVGIVGRTGAGKSSLTLALFRIIEAAGGQILIDGEDIAQYGLYDVRSKLSIIPQDPVLFAGTVRENLDPFNSYSDQEIWRALEHAHLADVVRSKDEGL
ncbi:hypothetical protein LPJ57_005388, partial [Coemansia sp. RSA 486]